MKIVSTVLFGKYQLCKILGTGRAGTVFLAVHLGLEEYRAIKRVSKSFLDYDRFRREALILKDLRHPGIPIVYDLEEDESYSYLIEEYLEGESLFDLVKSQGHLPRELTVYYGIQLTRIIIYLHIAGEHPILHLDLQPKNLLLCQDTIKLIDFDHASSPHEANVPGERYGTIGFAAPEQYQKDGVLDERTDIYAIGVILYYMSTGQYPQQLYDQPAGIDERLGAVIGRCLKKDKEKRFSSAQELKEQLLKLQEKNPAVENCLNSSSLKIAFAGSKSGAGTTHLAIGLSVYLNNQGYPNLYEEKNESAMASELGRALGAKRDAMGLMRCGGFIWKPFYGPGVSLREPVFAIRILDYGNDYKRALSEGLDAIVLVCDGSFWSRESSKESARITAEASMSYGIIYNHMVQGGKIVLPKGGEPERFLKAPYFSDPFKQSREALEFYGVLLKVILRGRGLLEKKEGKRKGVLTKWAGKRARRSLES